MSDAFPPLTFVLARNEHGRFVRAPLNEVAVKSPPSGNGSAAVASKPPRTTWRIRSRGSATGFRSASFPRRPSGYG
jgi:hypothetical protein